MNLWYLLLLVCCCGHGGRGCCTNQNSCIMPRTGGCMERRERRHDPEGCMMPRQKEECDCREKRQEADRCSCMMPGREKRYDSGMQEHPCMDNVPEMNMPGRYPVYPEKCACRE